ncbi:MAG: sigma-70 family RNA polymerase sigma factor [Clostridia bacterium]|nr:sigma-70 family RNA polymerase sigma factor [Clostridia bacterium]
MAKRTDGSEPREALTDEQIVDLYWNRDERAIAETDYKYSKFLYRIAYHMLCDHMDSEECRNDTYLKAWNAIPPTRPRVLQAFLTQIIRRIAISRYREKKSKKRVPSEMIVSMEDLYRTLHTEEAAQQSLTAEVLGKVISEYLDTLSDKQQYMFVGRYYMADSIEDIAKMLGTTKFNIYKQLTAIKAGLREHLERNGVSI